jgi:hypothetical protein
VDKFIGPGATRAEKAMQAALTVIAAIAAPLYASQVGHWTLLQYIVCALLAFDVAGGVITNATSSAKCWYHRQGRGFKQHFGFVSLHLVQIFIVAWLYLDADRVWFMVAGGYLLLSAAIILMVPLYLQRLTAVIFYACGLLIAVYLLTQPVGLEWFLPLFYLKVLVSHLPTEEPYRPANEG